MGIRIMITQTCNNFSVPCNSIKTQSNQPEEINIGNAKNCLNFIIQIPGFGKRAIKFGKIDKVKYGNAIPVPKDIKINKTSYVLAVTAYPIALPIKGAVHGVATITVNSPIKKDPPKPFFVSYFPSLVKRLPN